MSDYFKGVTFPWQEVTAADDAIVRRAALPDRRLTGCELSHVGSTLTMTAGSMLVCGRQFRHTATQSWSLTGAASGFARLLITIDVSKASTEDAFEQVSASIEYATAVDGFPVLRQDDINGAGTIYQTAICIVSLSNAGITGLVNELISGAVTAEDVGARPNTWIPTAGETGAVAKSNLMKLAHSSLDSNGNWTVTGVTSYPISPGIYRCTGNCPNLPAGVNGYGNLQITSAGGYALHLYREGGMLYFAESATYDDTIAVPASWRVAGGAKKLWGNASPTSAFGSQTISLKGYTNYNALLIVAKAHISSGNTNTWVEVALPDQPGGIHRKILYDGTNEQHVVRAYEWNSSGIFFEGAAYQQGTSLYTNNEFAVPIAIYGI